jgi:hypothetical protein
MNKKIKVVIFTLMVLVVTSISSFITYGYDSALKKKTPQGVQISEKNIKRNNEAIDINLKIPVVSGVKDKAIENKINNMFYKDAVNFANPLEKDAKKYLADTKKNKNLHFNKYSAYTTYKTKYNKNNILSIPVRYAQYTGGANGLEVQRGYTFNLNNGKLLSLSDLFDKRFNYKKVISDEVLKQMKANKAIYFPEAISGFKQINGTQPYYLEDGNLVVFYGPFEIAPHYVGIPEFKIPFSSLKFTNNLSIK